MQNCSGLVYVSSQVTSREKETYVYVVIDTTFMDSVPVVLHPPYSIQFGVVVKQDVVISIAIEVLVALKVWFVQGSAMPQCSS